MSKIVAQENFSSDMFCSCIRKILHGTKNFYDQLANIFFIWRAEAG